MRKGNFSAGGQGVQVTGWDGIVLQFFDLIPYTYECPFALKFTEQEVKPGNTAAMLSVALNTPLAKFDTITITPAQVGLVILKGVIL